MLLFCCYGCNSNSSEKDEIIEEVLSKEDALKNLYTNVIIPLFENFKEVIVLHNTYRKAYVGLFMRVTDLNVELSDNIMNIAAIIFRCFVPILSKIYKMPDYEKRFNNSIYGLIEGISNPVLTIK